MFKAYNLHTYTHTYTTYTLTASEGVNNLVSFLEGASKSRGRFHARGMRKQSFLTWKGYRSQVPTNNNQVSLRTTGKFLAVLSPEAFCWPWSTQLLCVGHIHHLLVTLNQQATDLRIYVNNIVVSYKKQIYLKALFNL